LSETSFLCSAGIRVLLQYWRQLKNAGKKLLVTRPSAEVNAALDMTGFKDAILEKV
jgi:anti-anti-sigma factor